MKYFTKIVLIAIFLFASLFNQQAYSQCGETLDQKQEIFNLGTMGSDQWQSFTAGQSGKFTKLQLFHNGCINLDFTLSVYSGTGTSGTLLYSQNYNFGYMCSQWFDILIPSNVAPTLANGSTYTFRIQGNGTYFTVNNPGPYGGGIYWSNAYGSTPWDLTFRTYITNNDTEPPVVLTKNLYINLGANGTASITANDVNNGSSDNCGITSLTVSPNTFDCDDISTGTDGVLKSRLSVDNGFELYISTNNNSAGTLLTTGDNFGVKYTNTTNLVQGQDYWIHVKAIDLGLIEMFIGDFQLTGNFKFDNGLQTLGTNTTNWKVSKTGFGQSESSPISAGYQGINPWYTSGYAYGAYHIWESVWNTPGNDVVYFSTKITATSTSNLVTLTATDASGNTSSNVARVIVKDNLPPTVITQNVTVQLDANNNSTITANAVNNGSYDNCGIATMSVSPSTFNCSNVGNNQVTLTVTDNSGNVSTSTANVTVQDATSPIAISKNVVVQLNANGTASITVNDIDNGSSDNCGIQSITVNPSTFDCSSVSKNPADINIATPIALNYAGRTVTYSAVNLNNNGNKLVVSAGTPITLSLNWNSQYTQAYCPGCIQQYYVGIQGVFSECLYSGNTSSYRSGSRTVTFNAPSTPGVYYVQTNSSLQYSCVAMGYSTMEQNAIGAIIVAPEATLSVTDQSGNLSISKSFVFVEDVTPPTVITQDITVALGANGMVDVNATQIDNGSNDACGIVLKDINKKRFYCSDLGQNQIIFKAIDKSGNLSYDYANVTVVDNTAPTAIAQNVNLALNAGGNAVLTTNQVNNGSYDNCGIKEMTLSQYNFDCSNVGNNVVTFTVKDSSGNESYLAINVYVVDNTAPTAIAQNLTVSLDANGNATISANDVNNGSYDNCGIQSLTVAPSTFNCSNIGTNNVVLTVTDNNGNTSTANAVVTVIDNTAPTAIAQNFTVSLDANGNATITTNIINNGSYDNCGVQSLTVAPSTFNCSNIGNNNVVLTVTDNNGNTSIANAIVTVNDDTAPTVFAQNLTVSLDANGIATITTNDIDNGSFDNCGIETLSVSPNSFDCSTVSNGSDGVLKSRLSVDNEFELYISTDNNTAGTQLLTGNNFGVKYTNQTNLVEGQDYWIHIKAIDVGLIEMFIGDFSLTGSFQFDNGAQTLGTNTTNWKVSKTGFGQNETTPIYAGYQGSAPWYVSGFSYGAYHIWESVWNTPGNDVVYFSTKITATSNSNMVTLTATDASGNTSSANAKVIVKDNIAPTAIAQNVTVSLDANGNATITTNDINNGSYDNCAIQSMTVAPNTFNCNNLGTNNVVLTVTDASGNTSTANAVVTVNDNTLPTAIAQSLTVSLDANGNTSVTAEQVNNGSFDNCTIATLSVYPNSFNCSNVGTNDVTLTVTDNSGNTSIASAVITVVDDTAPTAICQNFVVELDVNGYGSITVDNINNGSFDNCGIQSIVLSNYEFNCSNVGANTVTLTVTDNSGNVSTCDASVNVFDSVDPIPVVQNITVYLDNNGLAFILPLDIDNGSFDNCGISLLSLDITEFDCSNLGENNVVLTVTDVNGNTSSAVAVVTVMDNIAPSISVVVSPSVLWPANHKLQTIHADVISNDNCGAQVFLKSITSNEPDNGLGDGDTPNDIQNATFGTADYMFDLRKERSGKNKAGRTYTIVYAAVDASGNETTATAYVYVPHSMGKIGDYEDAIAIFQGAELEVYPNPTSGIVNINFLSEINGDIDLRLMNLAGAELMSFSRNSVNAYDNVLNLSDYPAGTYLLEVKFNYEIKVIKIIKY